MFGTPNGLSSAVADPRPNFEKPDYARVWISYTGTSDGDVAHGSVRVRCDATGEEWDVAIHANTRARPSVAIMLSLDQSGSMDDPAGDLGAKRIEVLREAALRFVELIPAGNAVGLVRFDHDAYPVGHATYPGLAMTPIASDDMADPGRNAARAAVMAHATNFVGATSIGDGVVMARNVLNPVTGYDEKAIVVLTDGIENQPASIASVLGSIDQRTFAIGLGTEAQVSTAGLMALAGASNGYLLVTGHLTTGTDDYFRLTKYFHQILAGITRTDIVRDPSGHDRPGREAPDPFPPHRGRHRGDGRPPHQRPVDRLRAGDAGRRHPRPWRGRRARRHLRRRHQHGVLPLRPAARPRGRRRARWHLARPARCQ